MKLTTKGIYTLQALLDMIENTNGKAVKLSDVAERQKISLNYLQQLFRTLKINGVVKSVRGPGGGYLLTREPKDITVEQVLRGVGESLEYHQATMEEGDSEQKRAVVVFTCELDVAVGQTLAKTLDQLVAR